jgi:hypothetical protein
MATKDYQGNRSGIQSLVKQTKRSVPRWIANPAQVLAAYNLTDKEWVQMSRLSRKVRLSAKKASKSAIKKPAPSFLCRPGHNQPAGHQLGDCSPELNPDCHHSTGLGLWLLAKIVFLITSPDRAGLFFCCHGADRLCKNSTASAAVETSITFIRRAAARAS